MKPDKSQEAPQENTDPLASYDEPVAYGADGQPLYAHPIDKVGKGPQFVHMTRSVSPVKPELTPELQKRHDESVANYPGLNISEEEYIIQAVPRHLIGIFGVLLLTLILVLLVVGFYYLLAQTADMNEMVVLAGITLPSVKAVFVPFLLVVCLILLGGYIGCYVYLQNRFYLTNESVIQEIQLGLLNHDEQTISLANIEDVSFKQDGILQHLFDYGTIRLSTEGDETTYTFSYATNPKEYAAQLNNAVEAFKNGRPIDIVQETK